MLNDILKAHFEFGFRYLNDPKCVYMSRETFENIRKDINEKYIAFSVVAGVESCDEADLGALFGMAVMIRDELPLNMCVIGGVIIPETKKERSKTE